MISQKLIDEFKQIFKEEYGVEYTEAEAHEAAKNLVGYFEVLIKADKRKKQKGNDNSKNTQNLRQKSRKTY